MNIHAKGAIIENCGVAARAEDGGYIDLEGATITDCGIGLSSDDSSNITAECIKIVNTKVAILQSNQKLLFIYLGLQDSAPIDLLEDIINQLNNNRQGNKTKPATQEEIEYISKSGILQFIKDGSDVMNFINLIIMILTHLNQ